MINLLQKLFSFLKYWYFRYMLVTELYMVEEWERNFISILSKIYIKIKIYSKNIIMYNFIHLKNSNKLL